MVKKMNSHMMPLRDELGLWHFAELPKAVGNLSGVPFDQLLVSGYSCTVVSVLPPQVINKCRFTFALWPEEHLLLSSRACSSCASDEGR